MIYVDEIHLYPNQMVAPGARPFGKKWCHLWTDFGNEAELHRFAKRIGLKRAWYQDKVQFPHYDLTPGKRILAVAAGAVETDLKTWLVRSVQKIASRKREDAISKL